MVVDKGVILTELLDRQLRKYVDELEEVAVSAIKNLEVAYTQQQIDVLIRFNSSSQFIKDTSSGYKIITLLSKKEKKLFGFLQYLEFPKYIRLIKIFVHPSYENRGYGSKLISVVKALNKPIVVDSALTQQAINFYKKNGFREISIREKMIGGVTFKVLVMSLPSEHIRVRIRKMAGIHIVGLGDVLFQTTERPPFKDGECVDPKVVEDYFKEGSKKGTLRPLVEYPFYDLEKV